MSSDPISDHLNAPQGRRQREMRVLAGRIVGRQWPGGPADRTEPAARSWVAKWRPGRAWAAIPACTCSSGHCAVCN